MPAAAVADRDEETEWDPVPDTIVRLTSRQTAETTPSPAEHSLSFKREVASHDLTSGRRLNNLA